MAGSEYVEDTAMAWESDAIRSAIRPAYEPATRQPLEKHHGNITRSARQVR